MILERSRAALREATRTVEELRAAKNKPELFRDKFPLAMGAVQRVGSIIAAETESRRTSEFGMWWKRTQSDPLHTFMRDVRNAEFKRGERRQRATHYGRATLHLGGSFSARGEVRDAEGRLKEGRPLAEVGRSLDLPPSSDMPSPEPLRPPKSTDWHFAGGGLYDGQEIFSVVDRYLAWLRDEVLPTAERLTR